MKKIFLVVLSSLTFYSCISVKFPDSINADIKVDAEKEILDSEIDQLVADAYNADKALIKTRMKEDSFSEYLSKTFTYIGSGVSMFIDTIGKILQLRQNGAKKINSNPALFFA